MNVSVGLLYICGINADKVLDTFDKHREKKKELIFHIHFYKPISTQHHILIYFYNTEFFLPKISW